MARKSAKSAGSSREVNIGLSASSRETVIGILNTVLADAFVLYARARAFHWNVTGRHFESDHALFETEYEALDETIDAVAERARMLGGAVPATLAGFARAARIKETGSVGMASEAIIAAMLDGHEQVIRDLRKDIARVEKAGDEATVDFLVGLMEGHEKRAWMLRAHLG